MIKRLGMLAATVAAVSVVSVAGATAANATATRVGFYTDSNQCISNGLGYQAQGKQWRCAPDFVNGQSGWGLWVF